MGRVARVVGASAVTAAIVVALAGCAVGTTAQPTGVGSGAAATPTPTAHGVVLDCDRLMSTAERTSLIGADATSFGATSAQAAKHLDALDSAAARSPLALAAVGGAECGWAHGDDALTVRVLPHASDAWSKLADAYPNASASGAAYDGGEARGGDCQIGSTFWCHTNVLVEGAWLAVDARSATSPRATEASFHAIVQGMLPVVKAAVADAPQATARTELDCNSDGLRQELQSAFDRRAITNMGIEETFRIEAGVLMAGGASVCQFQPSDDGSGGYFGAASILRDASAEYELNRAAVLAADSTASSTTVTVGGTEVPVLVWTRASDSVPITTADALVDGTWIQFRSIDADADAAVELVKWIAVGSATRSPAP